MDHQHGLSSFLLSQAWVVVQNPGLWTKGGSHQDFNSAIFTILRNDPFSQIRNENIWRPRWNLAAPINRYQQSGDDTYSSSSSGFSFQNLLDFNESGDSDFENTLSDPLMTPLDELDDIEEPLSQIQLVVHEL